MGDATAHVERAAGRWRPTALLAGLIVLVGGFAAAFADGAEQADSGWAVATPTIATSPQAPVDPELRMLLEHVLEQTSVPVLAAPPTGWPQGGQTLRVAERGAAADGWRPVATGPATNRPPAGSEFWPPGLNIGPAYGVAPNPSSARPLTSGGSPKASLRFRVLPNGPMMADADSAGDHSAGGGSAATAGVRGPVLRPTDGRSSELLTDGDSTSRPSQSDASSEVPPTEALSADGSDAPVEPPASDDDGAGEMEIDDDQEDTPAASAPTPPPPPPPLTRQLSNLRSRVRSVLRGYYQKSLNSREHDPWEAMHGMLAYGVHSRIHQGSPRGEYVTAVGWLCYNRPCKGQTLLYVTPEGELRAKYGVGLQGHMGQLLAMLAQSHVSPDYPIRVGEHEFTVRDLVEAEKKTCYADSELTFKLIALSHYLDLDTT